jgi:Na+-driven multidrug efflux pump
MFDGPVWPVTIRIGAPILLANLLQFCYAIVDTLYISRLDPSSTALLSGTGLMFPLFFVFMAAGSSIGVGVSALVGRVIGEENRSAMPHVMASGLMLVLCIALTALPLAYFCTRYHLNRLSFKPVV